MKRSNRVTLPKIAAFRPDNLPKQGKHGRTQIVHMRVPDPMPDPKGPPGQQSIAAVNIKRDVLLYEFGRGRISEAAYLQGRLIQQALEYQGGGGGSQWAEGDRVDAGSLVAFAIARGIDRARAAVDIMTTVHRELGKLDAFVVIVALRQPGTWSELAEQWPFHDGGDPHNLRKMIAARFRQSLEAMGQVTAIKA
jgi:hypothetical protein